MPVWRATYEIEPDDGREPYTTVVEESLPTRSAGEATVALGQIVRQRENLPPDSGQIAGVRIQRLPDPRPLLWRALRGLEPWHRQAFFGAFALLALGFVLWAVRGVDAALPAILCAAALSTGANGLRRWRRGERDALIDLALAVALAGIALADLLA